MGDKTAIGQAWRKWAWITWERLAPSRPKWLHMALCPFCRGYLLARRSLRREWSAR